MATKVPKARTSSKGFFFPKHPKKYVGNLDKITFRSSWERRFMEFCDSNIKIMKWGSEEIKIPYVKPTTGRVHHYYPDFFIVYENSGGDFVKEIIEIKPLKERVLTPKSTNYDKVMISINRAKWAAAEQFCTQHNIRFRILSENELFRT